MTGLEWNGGGFMDEIGRRNFVNALERQTRFVIISDALAQLRAALPVATAAPAPEGVPKVRCGKNRAVRALTWQKEE